MTDATKMSLDTVINDYAKQALRTIALAYKDIIPGECGQSHELPLQEEIKVRSYSHLYFWYHGHREIGSARSCQTNLKGGCDCENGYR
jgi:hypothetical protein